MKAPGRNSSGGMVKTAAAFIGAMLVATVTIVVAPTLAAAPPASSDTGKVTITSDHFVVKDTEHQAIFSGNVVVVQPKVTVHADQVVADYGKKGATSLSKFQATGHVVLITTDQTATGDLAVFDPKTQHLTVTGDVVVTNKTGRVKNEKLIVDLSKHQSMFSSKGGRITGIFTEEE
jgi:lipopolysaccharide export system protein LptA